MTDQATTAAADRRREYQREYYRKNRKKYIAYQRKYRAMYRKMRKELEAEEARRIRREAEEARRIRREAEEAGLIGRERKTPGGRPTREELRLLKCQRTVPLHDIMRAKVKPKGVSDIRWRMELSRRRLAAKERGYGGKGDLASLPDPDMMW
mgnify:CR=1 FL=1